MNKKLLHLSQKLILASADFMAIFVAFFLALGLVSIFLGPLSHYIPTDEFMHRLGVHAILGLCCIIWFWGHLRHYSYRKAFWSELNEIVRTVGLLSIFELAFLALAKLETSRYIWLFTWTLALFLMPLFRTIAKIILIKLEIWNRDTFIIGSGNNALDAYAAIKSEPLLGFNICGFFQVTDSKLMLKHNDTTVLATDSPSLRIEGLPVFEDTDIILNWHDKENAQFIIALEQYEIDLRDQWLRALAKAKIRNIFVIPTMRGVPLYGTDMSVFFSHDVLMLRLKNNLARLSSKFIKRSVDIIAGVSLLVLLSPFMLYIAYLISRKGGAPVFGHERVGQNGKKFQCLKFRTMVLNSKEVLDHLLMTNAEAKIQWDKEFKLKDDPRITRVGKFLRKTSLDELPQLWNVVKGEMSLVGPRPVVTEELERFGEDVDYYLLAKPGMTGLWQVSGRNDIDYDTRVYLDAWYVKNWSLWNDFVILCKTVRVVLKRNGAY
jgi:Undecaprenyl-phosphate galactose phosphotransferase WbaP